MKLEQCLEMISQQNKLIETYQRKIKRSRVERERLQGELIDSLIIMLSKTWEVLVDNNVDNNTGDNGYENQL